LKHEESFIWDENIEKYIKDSDSYKNIAKDRILAFPSFNSKAVDPLKKNKLINKIERSIVRIRENSLWSDDQNTAYHSLVSLQQLKRDILIDKLTLCEFASIASLNKSSNSKSSCHHIKSKFMIARTAIMSKVSNDYIDRLYEYRQHMELIADLSSESMPQSSIKRRREIELYSNFLSERTRTMKTDFSLLLNDLGYNEINADDYLILHNWHHKNISESKTYSIPYGDIRPKYSSHISSHFWTPERPDLQPIIAHEVAHIFIKNGLDDLKNYKMESLEDDFSLLLINIKKIIVSFIQHHPDISFGIGFPDSQTITREIACDFLASSVKGQSFLYAHFLEYFSSQFSFLNLAYNGNGDEIDINLIHTAKYSSSNNYYDSFEWYLRVLALTAWVNSTWYKNKKNHLDQDLIDGIEKITSNLISYYLDITENEEDRKAIILWMEMTKKIVSLIKNQKRLCKKIISFKYKREKNEYNKNTKKTFPQRSRRLDYRVRNSLYKMQAWMKYKSGRPFLNLSKDLSLKEIDTCFNNFYIGDNEQQKIIKKEKFDTPPLYKYIHDIPWQSSLMRAKDIYWRVGELGEIKKRTVHFNKFIHEITNEFPLGRDLFSYALEFHLYTSNKASDRLVLLKNLIRKKEVNFSLSKLIDNVDLIEKVSCFKVFNVNKSLLPTCRHEKEKRKFERNCGRILKSIHEKLEKNIENVVKNKEILSIYNFLSSRSNNNIEKNPINIIRSSFLFSPPNKEIEEYKYISESFDNKNLLYTSYIIAKYVISATNKQDEYASSKIRNIRNIDENTWSKNRESIPQNKIDRYHKRLGRNDILQISSTTSLCRCPLPNFRINKNENYPLFISRKELAIPIRLGKKEWSYISAEEKNEPTPLAAISLSLKQPSFRLSLIYRLIKSIDKKEEWSHKNGMHIESIGSRFSIDNDILKLNDCAFLTDGRDDLLLVFADTSVVHDKEKEDGVRTKKLLKRIDDIYDIQDALYQDFMVDRTRLFFMPQALNIFKDQAARKNYKAIIKLRLKEDRSLELSNHSNELKKIQGLYKTPGQYDYEVDMDAYFKGGICPNILEIIDNKILTIPYLDYTETQILKKWSR